MKPVVESVQLEPSTNKVLCVTSIGEIRIDVGVVMRARFFGQRAPFIQALKEGFEAFGVRFDKQTFEVKVNETRTGDA